MTRTDPALRLALRSMLRDETYPAAWKATPWVEARLVEADWPDEIRGGLQALARRWATHCGPTTALALRQAVGEELTDDERTVLEHPAKFPSTHTPTCQQQGGSLMEPAFERELAIVAAEFQRPPYVHADRGSDTRLTQAVALVRAGKVTRSPDGFFEVEGSAGRRYSCNGGCSCPQSQHGKSKWCYHLIAKTLYVEVCARLGQGTRDTLPLPLGPATAEEYLAQIPPTTAQDAPQGPQAPPDDLEDPPVPAGLLGDPGAKHEVAMTTPRDDEYIPEPEYSPEPEAAPPARDVPPPVPAHLTLTHAGVVMYEAPYSATVSVEDAAGYQFLLTVRKTTGKEFREAVSNLVAWCKQQGLKPQARRAPAAVPPSPSPMPAPATPPAPAPETPVCPYHGPLKPSAKAPGTFYCSRRMADGSFCRERFPKATKAS